MGLVTPFADVILLGAIGGYINERTKFYEPYGGTNYLYLARYSGVAKAGIYNFVITSRAKAGITLGVGEKEIFGEVVRGEYVAPTP